MAEISRAVLSWSRPVTVSRRLTGVPAARLADSWRMRRSPPYLDKGWIPAKHLKPGMHLKAPDIVHPPAVAPGQETRATGVCPRGAQVRARPGRSDCPASSSKQIHAPVSAASLVPSPRSRSAIC